MPQNMPPLALDAPATKATLLTTALVESVLSVSQLSPRKRIIQKLHKTDDEVCHRMFNAMQPGTYFRPHKHSSPPKNELLLVLRGALRVILFDEQGEILEHHDMSASGNCFGIDLSSGVIHTIIVLEPDTFVFEAKTGPYTQATDKDFALWAPLEGTPEAASYLEQLKLLTSVA